LRKNTGGEGERGVLSNGKQTAAAFGYAPAREVTIVKNPALGAGSYLLLFTPYNRKLRPVHEEIMPLSGEAIRLMNYIDDVAVTLRRVLATIPVLSAEERAKVAEHLVQARPSAQDVVEALNAK